MIIYIWISRPFELQKILPYRPFVVLERESMLCLIRNQFPYFQLFTLWSLLLQAYTLELNTGSRDYSTFTTHTLAVFYPVSLPSRHFGIKGAREVQFTSGSTSGFSVNCVLLAIDFTSSHSSIFKKIIKITRSHFQHQYSLWLKNMWRKRSPRISPQVEIPYAEGFLNFTRHGVTRFFQVLLLSQMIQRFYWQLRGWFSSSLYSLERYLLRFPIFFSTANMRSLMILFVILLDKRNHKSSS